MSNTTEWLDNVRIAVIGLGYVGLPLAVEFGKKFPVIGFDIDAERIEALQSGTDKTLETSSGDLNAAKHLKITNDPTDLQTCNCYIVTVPTPIDRHKRPDLTPLLGASEIIGKYLKLGDTVIYESTVFPGATEENCVPLLENISGLCFNEDFFAGYSPERINPGDKVHRLTSIVKVTSGSTPATADRVDALYKSIITAGTYKASAIRIAEAAKVIENTQRDLNIALINELAIFFNKMGIETNEVLKAAATKWNFLSFKPGLVGGHCIGVDPYYLTHKAEEIGFNPQVILAGRRINDGMAAYVAAQMVRALLKRRIHVNEARVLLMGVTFKENCPDMRNSKAIDVITELSDYGAHVDVYDPWADCVQAEKEYGISIIDQPAENAYDGIMIAVPHDAFRKLGPKGVRRFGKEDHVLYDLKCIFDTNHSDIRL